MLKEYKIKTEEFEGPLELLLELIEKEKLDITRISIAKVADDFLKFINLNSQVGLANISDFLLIASQLILIKSKALLPLFQFTKEEEEEIGDLEERLKEYKRFKDASEKIGELYFSPNCSYSRQEENIETVVRFVDPKINSQELAEIFSKIVSVLPAEEQIEEKIMENVVSLEEKISEIRVSLERRLKVAFQDTIKNATNKIDIIVSFLAMLEMMKQQIVAVEQNELFGNILLKAKRNV